MTRLFTTILLQICFFVNIPSLGCLESDLLVQEMNEEGSYLFRALLPSKDRDSHHRVGYSFAGLLILVDSLQTEAHISCEQLFKMLNKLSPVLNQAYINNNMFKCPKKQLERLKIVFYISVIHFQNNLSPEALPSVQSTILPRNLQYCFVCAFPVYDL